MKRRFPRTKEPKNQVPIRTLKPGDKFEIRLVYKGPLYDGMLKGEIVYITRGSATVVLEDHTRYQHWDIDTLVVPIQGIKRFPRTLKRFPRTPKPGKDGHYRFPRT